MPNQKQIKELIDSKKPLPKMPKKAMENSMVLQQTSILEYFKEKKNNKPKNIFDKK
tara:strand:+ start:556 stop:723 length:168 start_codon:yes stop_codon:yes gene_type:complete